MDIKIEFDPADVAKKLHEAIISETFKTIFSEAVEREIKRLSEAKWNTDNIVRETVENYIRRVMRDILDTEYKPKIEAIIREKLTDEKLSALSSELMERIVVKDRY